MERQKVLVHIKGMQFSADLTEEDGAIEMVAPGILQKIGDQIYIKYEELQEGFDKGSDVLLRISPGHLEMSKRGLLNVHMDFVEGTYSQSDYRTPFGELLFGIRTREVELIESPHRLQVSAAYTMELNGEHLCESTIEIACEML